jgi:dolichyl-phosphate-mannose--protein O-mannosyl transferase
VNLLPVPTDAELRQAAIKRLKKKRDFRGHLFIYIVVNVAFWTGWIIDGAVNTWVFPWPAFPTVFWGLFVIGHANDLFWRDPLREELVQREIEDLRAASRIHPLDTYDLGDDDNC